MPILLAALSYGLFYVAARPLLTFIHQTVTLITLDKPPQFKTQQTAATFKKGESEKTATKAAADVDLPKYGALFGRLSIAAVSLQQPVYYGDGAEQLAKGAGMFNGSSFPGFAGTTLIAGHNTSAMGALVDTKIGQQVKLETTYGTYLYEITQTKIAQYDDAKAFDLSGHHKLVLYTCYPTTTLGYTDQRFVVYATLVSGPRFTTAHA